MWFRISGGRWGSDIAVTVNASVLTQYSVLTSVLALDGSAAAISPLMIYLCDILDAVPV